MVFCDESDECAERIEGMQGMRNDVGGISLEGTIHGFEIILDFLISEQKSRGLQGS